MLNGVLALGGHNRPIIKSGVRHDGVEYDPISG